MNHRVEDARTPSITRDGIVTQHVSWASGGWTVIDWTPPPKDPLCGIVERIWHARGDARGLTYRILPHGMAEIAVLQSGDFRVRQDSEWRDVPDLWSVQLGSRLKPLHVQALSSRFQVTGARLHPALACHIVGRPLDALETVVDLELILGHLPPELQEASAPSLPGPTHVRWLRRWLRSEVHQLRSKLREDGAGAWMADQIVQTGGAVRIAELEARMGLSRHRLSAKFRRWIGLTPKRFARLHRFRRLLWMLREESHSLSSTAIAAGYYDQAHMTNEFRDMSGMTPLEFRSSLPRFRSPSYRLVE